MELWSEQIQQMADILLREGFQLRKVDRHGACLFRASRALKPFAALPGRCAAFECLMLFGFRLQGSGYEALV